VGIPEAADWVWATRYMNDDVWLHAGIAKGAMRQGNVVIDTDLVPEEEFLKSKIYREHLQYLQIGRLCSGVVFDGTSSDLVPTVVSVARELDRPFTPYERDNMRLLVTHLSRALGVMYRLRDAELKVAASLAALDRLPSGVALLDGLGRIIHANLEAARIFDEKDGLTRSDRLSFDDAEARDDWLRVERSVLDRDVSGVPHFCEAVAVRRPSGRHALLLQAAPLARRNAFASPSEAAAIVFILDAQRDIGLDREAMRDLYQATPAEIRMAESLCAGRTVAQAAADHGISEATARSQLHALFEKTRTSRQADLIRVLLSLQRKG
jgi:DNA-binding CsgD family transcriptional regulator